MNISRPIGTSSVVFVTLSGLIWSGWAVGSQTPEGQEALARAYEEYAQQRTQAVTEDLFAPNALRAVVCGADNVSQAGREARPCLAVAAAGRLFIIDAGYGAAASLSERGIPLARLEAVLLTQAERTQSADLGELFDNAQNTGGASLLPVYGPADTQRTVEGLNTAGGFDGLNAGLQAWGPAPEPGRSVIVFESDGLVVSAFTTAQDAHEGRVGYRFDYRGRSLVVAGDGRAEWANATAEADVVLHSAQTTALTHLHQPGAATVTEAANAARDHNATLVLTGLADNISRALQMQEARATGLEDVVASRVGMMLELPLENSDVNVRPL
ncbi:MAG: hypothetical protein AB7J28_14695 [Hyphomonadaceae bacterium]